MIENIRKALDSHLATMPPAIDVAWPNRPYDPQIGTPWMRPNLLPTPPRQAELGLQGRNAHTGIYQISVFYPAGNGPGRAEDAASALVERFKRGTDVTYANHLVRCVMAGYRDGTQEPDWYSLIVEIEYRAYLPN
jgi:hypothetical protein